MNGKLVAAGTLLALLALVPFALIARARYAKSSQPRIHGWRDMDYQEKVKAQQENTLFADKRGMRAPVPGTVARGELFADTHYYQGRVRTAQGMTWVKTYPKRVQVDMNLLQRGAERYKIFCSMCHGYSGHGDGMVHKRVNLLIAKNRPGIEWTPPASYHSDLIRKRTLGELFNTVSNGKGNMAGYRAQIPVHDRWAIVAYMRALQISQKGAKQ